MAIRAGAAEAAKAVAKEHQDHQNKVRRAQAAAIARLYRQINPDQPIQEWIAGLGSQVYTMIAVAQEQAASEAGAYVDRSLAAQGIVGQRPPVNARRFAGIASDNRPLDTLIAGAPMRTANRRRAGATKRDAIASGEKWLTMVADTQIADASRAATATGLAALREARLSRAREALRATQLSPEREAKIAAILARRQDAVAAAEAEARAGEPEKAAPLGRGVSIGYVRMLQPPSCDRCAILAGRWYRWNTGFQRHPMCDCIHIPASEAAADDLTADPMAYFNSLSEEQQAYYFGKANAQAIRDGADIFAVVNAQREGAMFTADDGRRYTTVGTRARRRRRDGSAPAVLRPTVWQIMKDSKGDRAEALRMLTLYRYVTA